MATLSVVAGSVGSANAAIVDLTNPMTFGVINGARFETADLRAAGTGVINSFVRIQANGTEQGYNTSGRPVAFNENTSPTFTRNLTYAEVPIRNIGGTDYKEFLLDINQVASDPLLSLDKVQIYTSATGSQTTSNVSTLGTLRYDMDAGEDSWVRMNYLLATGSGQSDVRMYIPVSFFAGTLGSDFVYLFSRFGDNEDTNDGFEEWAVQDANAPVVPLPPAVFAGGASMLGLMVIRRMRRR